MTMERCHPGMMEMFFGGEYDDGNAYSDVEDPNTLVSQPRQVG